MTRARFGQLLESAPYCERDLHGPAEPLSVDDFFDELAVMVDTFRPLRLGEGGLDCEDPGYAWTWAGGRKES